MSEVQPSAPLSLADQKLQREIAKLDVEIAAARRSVSLERLKAWGALLAPVATALTIIGALWVGIAQLDSKRDEDEDQAWRDTVKALGDKTTDPTTESTLLQPFLKSKRYRTSAVATTAHVLPNLMNEDVFRELTNAAFGDAKPSDFAEILAIARKLSDSVDHLTGEIHRGESKPANPSEAKGTDQTVAAAKLSRSIIQRELTVLCDPIAEELRNYPHRTLAQAVSQSQSHSPVQATNNIIDMTAISFNRCDFSGVDLRDVDLGNSMFFRVKLEQAVIGDEVAVVFEDGSLNDNIWGGIAWWTAKYVAPQTLRQLVQQYKPNQAHGGTSYNYREGEPVDENSWRANVTRLCTSAGIACAEADIRMPRN